MPYLAVDLDARPKVAMAATAIGVHPGVIQWGLEGLWEWAWRNKTDVVGELIVFGCFGSDVRIVHQLVAHGFLDDLGAAGQYRVRGAERYLRISKARAKGGHAAKQHLKRGAGFPAHAGSEPESLPGASREPVPALSVDQSNSRAVKKRSPADAEEQTPRVQLNPPPAQTVTQQVFTSPTPDDLVEHVERCYREGAGGAAFEWGPHPNGREEQALRGLVDLLGEAKARALIATAFAPGFPQHGSLLGLQHDRNRLLQKAERMKAKATGPPTKGRATEADKDHSNQKVIRHADGFEELDLADGN